jgi:hypothetical protein
MEWEMKGGILVPKSAPPPICMFIDEIYLLGQSGFLQAAVPIPQDIYTQHLVPQSKTLLAKLGKDAKEFKGSSIKPGNADIYLDWTLAKIALFLQPLALWHFDKCAARAASQPRGSPGRTCRTSSEVGYAAGTRAGPA